MSKRFYWREWILLVLVIFSFTSLFFIPAIPQNIQYHQFADTRIVLNIPNFYDVISNLTFLIASILGINYVISMWKYTHPWSWLVLFLSILLIALGSSYYHLNPTNYTLLWDRLPMAICFMVLLAIILGDYIHFRLETWLLIPLCALGIFSVIYWHLTDDLRLYAFVQFYSIALLIIVVTLYKAYSYSTKLFSFAFILYLLSKIAEYFDKTIFTLTCDLVSGHTIKHLLAGTATIFIYLVLKYKKDRIS